MNNSIKESYCSFDISQRLKDRGFNCECDTHYELALTSKKNDEGEYEGSFGWKKGEFNIQSGWNTNDSLKKYYDGLNWTACSRPTHSVAIEWIRVNFGIWIEIRHIKTFGVNRFHVIIWKYGEDDYHTIHCSNNVGYEVWDTPQAASEAVLLYILNELI